MELTVDRIRQVVSYNQETGDFTWVSPTGRRVAAGDIAGAINRSTGYRTIKIDGQKYPAHRLAALFVDGKWPEHEVDHVNGNRADNRWLNLRSATRMQNMMNKATYSNNTSGAPGVSFHTRIGMWQARIGLNGKRVHLGYFSSLEAAVEARMVAETASYGVFCRARSGTKIKPAV